MTGRAHKPNRFSAGGTLSPAFSRDTRSRTSLEQEARKRMRQERRRVRARASERWESPWGVAARGLVKLPSLASSPPSRISLERGSAGGGSVGRRTPSVSAGRHQG